MSLDRTTPRCFALLIAIAAAGNAIATTLPPLTSDDLARSARLVFHGTVTAVEHRNADVVKPGDVPLPHTFVTFQVEQVLKGATGSSLTLRFQGGPDGQGRTLQVSGVPTFAVGERALLYVGDTDAPICPIVGFEQGAVHLDGGRALTSLGIELGSEGEVIARVAEAIHRLHTPEQLAALPLVRGNSMLELLRVTMGADMAPPVDLDVLAPANEDLLEAELLEKNGGDPVLPIR